MNTAPAASKPRRYVQGARAQAAEATGRRIAEAFLARLMTHWYDEITLDKIAADAGVTVQTIIRRFGGKEGLLAQAVQVLAEQINSTRTAPAGDIPRMVRGLLQDYERTGDALIRLLALEPRHASLSRFLNLGRRWHRQWVAGQLAGQLEHLDAPTRKHAVDALVVATDVYTWKLLRRDMSRSLGATQSAIESMIHAALAEFAKPTRKDH